MSEERNMIPLILTGIGTIIGTVGCLWYYGYLHFAKPCLLYTSPSPRDS